MQKAYKTVTCVAVEIFFLRLAENDISYGVGWKSLLYPHCSMHELQFLDVQKVLRAVDKRCFAP